MWAPAFEAVEKGLCQGLDARLYGTREGGPAILRPAVWRMPQPGDKDKLEPDPDAIYFKRHLVDTTNSPVIPFYWAFRERIWTTHRSSIFRPRRKVRAA